MESASDSWDQLRHLILEPEQAQLEELNRQWNDPSVMAVKVGQALPNAIQIGLEQDNRLDEAFMPLVEKGISRSIQKDMKTLINLLYPIMGPAIRKAISETLKNMLQAINRSLEQSFSWQGFKWRIKSWLTGRSFAEVVLANSLIYRVEQVFLIHRETGLLLHEVRNQDGLTQDGDMVSGMLKAIQDFVQDSFSMTRSEGLETIKVGELTVWVEQGPLLILAGVVRGDAPEELRLTFQSTMEQIHLEFQELVNRFNGDISGFSESEPLLKQCLQQQIKKEKKRIPLFFWIPVIVTAIIVIVWGIDGLKESRNWNHFLQRVKSEPGIIITQTSHKGGVHTISGMRDPLSSDPVNFLSDFGLKPEEIHFEWNYYHALNPEMILKRAERILEPPQGVRLALNHDTLVIDGTASAYWRNEVLRHYRYIDGISVLKVDRLKEKKSIRILPLIDAIQSLMIRFNVNTSQFAEDISSSVEGLERDIRELDQECREFGLRLRILVIGHTDASGPESINRPLSEIRAETITRLLKARGLPEHLLEHQGVGSSQPLHISSLESERAMNRRVSFRIDTIHYQP
ncbi:MAG: OmpA family protein [Candidatus Delongbacteria bacterium]|nr:OmpA family protein [Candidatus Delongbacteria bacterium]